MADSGSMIAAIPSTRRCAVLLAAVPVLRVSGSEAADDYVVQDGVHTLLHRQDAKRPPWT